MPAYEVVLRRRWFGEEMEQKLDEYDHEPSEGELRELAQRQGLAGSATLYVRSGKKTSGRAYRVRELPDPGS
ncbi:MAG: hypothetical protein HW414_1889 [Dehalococcoidia bacterium]|nr:hypothetical protein [Dehalococcoidia bacterium]